ncbi:MAG TPA: hypothetical protein ENK05_02045 [Gammaproteobacteria bacterium]|nr:hypothetical protein [Gammaproteobacteria bacterium]
MIFVMLGTNPYPFSRLLLAVDGWAQQSGERVIAQVGHTSVDVDHVECHDFVAHDRIMGWIREAEVVVSQGGFGSLRDCLRSGKPTVAVPRLRELGECQDEQSEIVRALEAEGRVVALYDVAELAGAIEEARHRPAVEPYQSRIPSIVESAVSESLKQKRRGA